MTKSLFRVDSGVHSDNSTQMLLHKFAFKNHDSYINASVTLKITITITRFVFAKIGLVLVYFRHLWLRNILFQKNCLFIQNRNNKLT